MSLVLNEELVDTIEQSETDVLFSRLNAIKGIKGNPMDVEIKRFGNATAFSVKNIPGPSFNAVKGLKDGDELFIKDIIDYYNEREIPVRFELTPAHSSPELLTYLSDAGFYQTDFHTTLYGTLSGELKPIDPEINIRRLKKDEFEIFADIYATAFQMPAFVISGIAQNNEILYDNENWHFHLATFKKEPAGIGVSYIKDGIATLAAAATVPQFRNKGIHSALIQERIIHAKMLKSKLVVGQAKFASISQNNMERHDMKIAYTKAIWNEKES